MGPRSRAAWRSAAGLLVLSAHYTLANATKPLHVDDPFAFYVARQIVSAPLDPFGLEIFWWQWPQPVHEYLLPPFVAYWGGLGLTLLGSDPFLWKLSLLPLATLFAASFFALARRFAPGLEWPLLVATLFSPALLPSLNYMVDVPALALGLGGLWAYLRAEERGSVLGAVAAGLLVGLALQTKYTAFATVGAVVLHGVLWRRWRLGLVSAATALTVFASWELAMTLRYGQGMFLGTLLFPQVWSTRLGMPGALVELLGYCLPGIGLLGLGALGLGRRGLAALALVVLLGHGLLLVGPLPQALAFAFSALVVLACLGAGVLPLRRLRDTPWTGWVETHREALFLALWLGGETLQCVLISPYPAMRRVMGVALVATFVIGHALARGAGRRPLPVWPLVALQVGLGSLYFGVDLLEARAQREAVRGAHGVIREIDPDGTIWFLGHWGFQFYAEELDMQAAIPDHSRLRAGDWLVVPDRVDQQVVAASPRSFREVRRVVVQDGVPLATLQGFYAGSTPLRHHPGPRLVVRLLRARHDTVPESGWTLSQLVDWAAHAGGSQAAWATPALGRELRRLPHPRDRREAADALAGLGPRAAQAVPALAESVASDPDRSVRTAACRALMRIDAGRAPDSCAELEGR